MIEQAAKAGAGVAARGFIPTGPVADEIVARDEIASKRNLAYKSQVGNVTIDFKGDGKGSAQLISNNAVPIYKEVFEFEGLKD